MITLRQPSPNGLMTAKELKVPNASNHTNNNRPSTAYGLLTQLTTGPSSREVASAMLRTALREQYPTLNLNPDLTMLVTPRWQVTDEAVIPAEPRFESLTSILARQALGNAPVIYLEGEHYLTLQPQVLPALHLPVKIDAIARLINELAPLLYTAFQEQQLDYWNASYNSTGLRWQVLATSLRKVWNVTTVEGWDEHDCAMARTLYHAPDLATRKARDPYQTHAYLIDIDLHLPDRQEHVGLLDMALLVGSHESRQVILAYSLIAGYERFDSLDKLAEVLPERLSHVRADSKVQWRLYEPPGNFFDSLACTLIGMQIEAIGALGNEADEQLALPLRSPTVARILPSIEDLSDHRLSNIRQIHQHLPTWLTNASDLEMAAYSRYMIDLAQLHTHYQGRSFRDDIPPIRDYAREQLLQRIRTHAQGAHTNVDKVQIVIQSPVIWGTFVVPGAKDVTRRSLIDLALDNLTGLPSGVTSVAYNGGDAPAWLTYDYLTEVIEALDIGARYPALIKQKLLDDPLDAHQRRILYTSHLRVQLPLLALQLKMQQRNGLDERGFLYIAALMQPEDHDRQVDGQSIVIRPLAFIPTLRPGHQQDTVANMFVIGPKDSSAGPCVLYRPLLEPTLLQFASQQNLLYAIKHHHSLRESILAWLPEESRFNYGQYVFPDTLPSPWTAVRVLVEPATLVYMSGPIELSDEALGADSLDELFKANANALIELATRQSVSNAQKRWETFRHTGWQIFSAALPFLGRSVGIAAWIWQIMDDLQEAEQAVLTPEASAPWTALVDMFLNLGMALALHVALRHPPAEALTEALKPLGTDELDLLETLPSKPADAIKPLSVSRLPDAPGQELSNLHQGSLHISGALKRTPASLGETLDSFAVTRPEGLGEQNKTAGAHLHLYPLAEKWYAPVGQRWFEVTLDANDTVQIIDPNAKPRVGPLLVSNLAGQWFVDTRLRLSGGGFRNRRRAAQQQQPSRIQTLRRDLNAFHADEDRAQAQLSASLAAIGSEPGPSTDLRREAFITQVDERLEAYDTPIRQLRALGIIDSVPNYQSAMIDYLNKQLVLTRTAVEERLPPFRALLLTTVDALEAETPVGAQTQADLAQTMSTMNVEMIRRMEYAESRFRELDGLGAAGARVILSNQQALPHIAVSDLRALQITISRYLCSSSAEGTEQSTARSRLHAIVDTVDLSVQSSIEMLGKANGTPLDQRIEVLNSLVEQFAIVDQRLLDLHADYPEHLLRDPLETLRRYIDDFNLEATQELVRLLRERRALAPKPGPSKPPAPRHKIIKTRFRGVVVGEPRASDSTLVDIKAPMTGKIIATFHEKTPGVWVEREAPSVSVQARAQVDLQTSLNFGQDLLNADAATTRRLQAHARKAGRIPVEIEEMFHQHASRLQEAADVIEAALTQLNLTESDRPPAAALKKSLADSATRLFKLGKSTRISMTKQQPPTAARVEWLHNEKQVTIKKTPGDRRPLKGAGKDYLEEWEIRDTDDNSVLWYAHFHYPSREAADEAFTAAHLKTREQQKLGGAFERRTGTDRDQIAIYRSEISPALAQSLFFGSSHAPGQA